MNIYEDDATEGVLNLGHALDELRRSEGMRDDRRRAVVAEIQTAALLDIAASLRPLAFEATLALRADFVEPAETGEGIELVEGYDDFFVVGDLIQADGFDEPGEITRIVNTEGEYAADVRFASGAEQRVWFRALTRLRGDEGEPEGDTPEEAEEARAAVDAALRDEDDDDDIEGDFADPAAALEALKSKAPKKVGPKKGKKS